MKKIQITITLMFCCLIMNAQMRIYEILEQNKSGIEIDTNIQTMWETDYAMGREGAYDTLINFKGATLYLAKSSSTLLVNSGPKEYVKKSEAFLNKSSFNYWIYSLNNEGLIECASLVEKTDKKEGIVKAKYCTFFDNKGRVILSTQQIDSNTVQTNSSVLYNSKGLIDSCSFALPWHEICVSCSLVKDDQGFFYQQEYQLINDKGDTGNSEELQALNLLPKIETRVSINTIDSLTTYSEGGDKYVYNSKGQIIEILTLDRQKEMDKHEKFYYDEKGKILKRHDMIANTIFHYRYDVLQNLEFEEDESFEWYYEYDEQENVVLKLRFNKAMKDWDMATIKNYTYRQ